MQELTDVLVSQVLDSLDNSSVNPTKQQRYLAFLLCKNLSDLCETGQAIVNNIESRGKPIVNLPDRNAIMLCQQILGKFYSDKMFIPDENYGNRPNWSVVGSFNKEKSDTAYKIYRAIRKNVIDSPIGKDIQSAIQLKNTKYFIQNFDKIFADIPFKDGLTKFKNFVVSPDIIPKDRDYVWDFFEALLDIFINEEENLTALQTM
jgi:hypothetical protein